VLKQQEGLQTFAGLLGPPFRARQVDGMPNALVEAGDCRRIHQEPSKLALHSFGWNMTVTRTQASAKDAQVESEGEHA